MVKKKKSCQVACKEIPSFQSFCEVKNGNRMKMSPRNGARNVVIGSPGLQQNKAFKVHIVYGHFRKGQQSLQSKWLRVSENSLVSFVVCTSNSQTDPQKYTIQYCVVLLYLQQCCHSIVLLYRQQMLKVECLSRSVMTFPQFLTIQESLFLSFQHLFFLALLVIYMLYLI